MSAAAAALCPVSIGRSDQLGLNLAVADAQLLLHHARLDVIALLPELRRICRHNQDGRALQGRLLPVPSGGGVAGPGGRSGRAAAAAPLVTGQDLLEGQPEFQVEDGVDDGIEGRVGIAEPGEKLEDDGRDAGFAKRCDDVDAKEGHPTDEKNAHDDAQGNGSLEEKKVDRLINKIPRPTKVLQWPR